MIEAKASTAGVKSFVIVSKYRLCGGVLGLLLSVLVFTFEAPALNADTVCQRLCEHGALGFHTNAAMIVFSPTLSSPYYVEQTTSHNIIGRQTPQR